MEIRGAVVVVTGGGSGMRRALCRRFADDGAAGVVVAEVNGSAAEAVAAEIGGNPFPTDVTIEAAVQSLVRRALEAYGRIDVYCSNAGIAFGGAPEARDDAWRRCLDVHVTARVYAARGAVLGMPERGTVYTVGIDPAGRP